MARASSVPPLPSDVVAVVVAEGTPADTAVVAMSGQAVKAMVAAMAVIAGSPRMRAMVATVLASAAMATVRACRLNTRIIPAIGAMLALASDRTLSVTITAAVVKAVPASPRADSLPVAVAVAVAAGSGIARAADARADDAKRNGGGASRDGDASRVRGAGSAVSPFGVSG